MLSRSCRSWLRTTCGPNWRSGLAAFRAWQTFSSTLNTMATTGTWYSFAIRRSGAREALWTFVASTTVSRPAASRLRRIVCRRSNASPVADWSFSSFATRPRQESDDTTSVGRKCLRPKVDLPLPLVPTSRTRERRGISRVKRSTYPLGRFDQDAGRPVVSLGPRADRDRHILVKRGQDASEPVERELIARTAEQSVNIRFIESEESAQCRVRQETCLRRQGDRIDTCGTSPSALLDWADRGRRIRCRFPRSHRSLPSSVPCPVFLLRLSKPNLDPFNVASGRFDSLRGFLLKDVEHVDRLFEFHGVDRPVGIAIEALDDLEDACSTEAMQRLGVPVLSSKLSHPKAYPNLP